MIASILGILLLLYLAQIRKPFTDRENYEGEIVEINGVVKNQRYGDDYSLLRIGNVTILSEILQNFTNKNITIIGRIHEDIVVADKIRINE